MLAASVAAQTERLDVDELKAQLDAGADVLLIDVREDYEVESGSIPGAIHIPVGELEARMPDHPRRTCASSSFETPEGGAPGLRSSSDLVVTVRANSVR